MSSRQDRSIFTYQTRVSVTPEVEVIEVNPAYASTMGMVNFAHRYGISVHQGAAIAIARRSLGLSERPQRV